MSDPEAVRLGVKIWKDSSPPEHRLPAMSQNCSATVSTSRRLAPGRIRSWVAAARRPGSVIRTQNQAQAPAASSRDTTQPRTRHPDFLEVGARAAAASKAGYTTATFTQWIGGSESKRQLQSSPPSRPIQSCPVVVPK